MMVGYGWAVMAWRAAYLQTHGETFSAKLEHIPTKRFQDMDRAHHGSPVARYWHLFLLAENQLAGTAVIRIGPEDRKQMRAYGLDPDDRLQIAVYAKWIAQTYPERNMAQFKGVQAGT